MGAHIPSSRSVALVSSVGRQSILHQTCAISAVAQSYKACFALDISSRRTHEKEHLSHRISVILGQYSLLPGRSQERASVGRASQTVADSLSLALGDPILLLDRVVSSLHGSRVEWRLGSCNLVDEYYMAEMS